MTKEEEKEFEKSLARNEYVLHVIKNLNNLKPSVDYELTADDKLFVLS